ncbi:MAG TPA: hypothetical protein VHQ90_04295 [Thermoanaerobaculia bacterium]|nr:hypothetical protein [Thermoanaerobaculia bacterium]
MGPQLRDERVIGDLGLDLFDKRRATPPVHLDFLAVVPVVRKCRVNLVFAVRSSSEK